MRCIKLISVLFIMGFCCSALALVPQAKSAVKPTSHSLDSIVAIVNDGIVTQSQLQLAIERNQQHLTSMGQTNVSLATIKAHALQQLIDQQLILQLAKQHNIKATPVAVDRAITRLASLNNTTVAVLENKLIAEGITLKQFRQDIANQIVNERMQRAIVGNKIVVTPAEIAGYRAKYNQFLHKYSQYRVADFAFLLDAPTAAQVQQTKLKALEVANKLRQGVDPSKVGVSYDDLGWRSLNQLPEIFVQPVSNLDLNGVSAPIVAPNGVHVLKVLEIRTPPNTGVTDQQLKNMVWQHKAELRMSKWTQRLRKTAYIKVMD